MLFDKKSSLDSACILFETFTCVSSCSIKKFGALSMNSEGFVCLRNKYNYTMVSQYNLYRLFYFIIGIKYKSYKAQVMRTGELRFECILSILLVTGWQKEVVMGK